MYKNLIFITIICSVKKVKRWNKVETLPISKLIFLLVFSLSFLLNMVSKYFLMTPTLAPLLFWFEAFLTIAYRIWSSNLDFSLIVLLCRMDSGTNLGSGLVFFKIDFLPLFDVAKALANFLDATFFMAWLIGISSLSMASLKVTLRLLDGLGTYSASDSSFSLTSSSSSSDSGSAWKSESESLWFPSTYTN